jgi:CRISPR-associated endonuclease/helicase Cas3
MTLTKYFNKVIETWFGGKNRRPFVEYAIKKLEENWNDRNVFVIEAPTGYGKSTISATVALYSINEELKSIIAFPLRTLLEDQYNKFRKLVDERSLGKRYMHNPDSRYLIKPITLTTVDTLSMTLFGIPPEDMDKVVRAWDGTSAGSLGHYLFSWASVALSNIVLDEVHLLADSTKSLSFLIALMKICMDFNQKLILMSATIPDSLKDTIKEHVPDVEFVEFKPSLDPEFCKERENKSYDVILEEISNERDKYRQILEWIRENDEFSKVTVVFNTVADAVRFYDLVKDKNAVLLHSRFSESDREKKLKKLQEIKNEGRYIIVSTQVIEAGVDISSNLFITEIAPANSLIQRLGRFLRYDERSGRVVVWYEGENGKLVGEKGRYKVYDYGLTQKTLDWLKSTKSDNTVNINVHLPEAEGGYKDLLNYVYSKDCFRVDRRLVKEFESVFLYLENAPRKAFDIFFKLGGSFVREGLLIPVAPKTILDHEIPLSKLVRSFVVPMSFETFKDKRNLVIGVIVEDGGNVIFRDVDDRLSDSWRISRYIMKHDVLAFVVDAEYDDELGLRFGKDG